MLLSNEFSSVPILEAVVQQVSISRNDCRNDCDVEMLRDWIVLHMMQCWVLGPAPPADKTVNFSSVVSDRANDGRGRNIGLVIGITFSHRS